MRTDYSWPIRGQYFHFPYTALWLVTSAINVGTGKVNTSVVNRTSKRWHPSKFIFGHLVVNFGITKGPCSKSLFPSIIELNFAPRPLNIVKSYIFNCIFKCTEEYTTVFNKNTGNKILKMDWTNFYYQY